MELEDALKDADYCIILAALYLRHVLTKTTYDCRNIYVLYHTNVLVTTRTPMAGLIIEY